MSWRKKERKAQAVCMYVCLVFCCDVCVYVPVCILLQFIVCYSCTVRASEIDASCVTAASINQSCMYVRIVAMTRSLLPCVMTTRASDIQGVQIRIQRVRNCTIL
jgi:hypothetical protein